MSVNCLVGKLSCSQNNYNNNKYKCLSLMLKKCKPQVLTGAAVVKVINHLACNPEFAGSIPGFTSLSDETLSRGPVSI